MRALVVAKAPVPGEVKTRLGAEVGMDAAAAVAAAALLDTVDACREAFGAERCVLALAGDLQRAVRGAEIGTALAGWRVFPQRGEHFGDRLANAHADVPPGSPVVQIGMDTPQVTAADLHVVAAALDDADAVLGPADDGGWWVLGLRTPSAAAALRGVPMSTPATYAETWQALEAEGVRMATTASLTDVDTRADAEAVAAAYPSTRFAHAWKEAVG